MMLFGGGGGEILGSNPPPPPLLENWGNSAHLQLLTVLFLFTFRRRPEIFRIRSFTCSSSSSIVRQLFFLLDILVPSAGQPPTGQQHSSFLPSAETGRQPWGRPFSGNKPINVRQVDHSQLSQSPIVRPFAVQSSLFVRKFFGKNKLPTNRPKKMTTWKSAALILVVLLSAFDHVLSTSDQCQCQIFVQSLVTSHMIHLSIGESLSLQPDENLI